ncbi:MAG TPA: hypothetical protein VN980_19855, partial [Alphaproteobacteria bacterium]|nr:hypothetical protein [Alphaproteobacteria bacterium]
MSFPGGVADKMGNIYEAKWAVRQLLDVLRSEAEAIRFESITRPDQGFEFQVERGGTVEHHQTKRRNSEGNWTLRRLETEGVFKAFQAKLSESETDRCVFVSQHPAPELSGLIDKAAIAQSAEELESASGIGAGGDLNVICQIWSVDRETAYGWLRRLRVTVQPEEEIDGLINAYAKICFSKSSAAFPILRTFLEERMNRRLSTEEIRRELCSEGKLPVRDWALDATLAGRIKKITDAYLDSYAPFGFSREVIRRTEAQKILHTLQGDLSKKLLILTGKAGAGKSGVIRQIIGDLRESEIPCMAFRIDRLLEGGGPDTAEDLGRILCERKESPIITLAGKYPSEPSVLLIDQVDAVSDVSGRGQRLKDIVLALIADALRFPFIRIVLGCRQFDFVNDQRLKLLDSRHDVEKIAVELLDWEREVVPVLLKLKVDPASIRNSERELLRLPL